MKESDHFTWPNILILTEYSHNQKLNMDIKTDINDALLNKIAKSAKYPLTLLLHDEEFDPSLVASRIETDTTCTLGKTQIDSLIDAVYKPDQPQVSAIFDGFSKDEKEEFANHIKSIYSDWIESLTSCLRAYAEAIGNGEADEFEWPEGETQQTLMEKKKMEPNQALKTLSIMATRTHLRRAKVELTQAPELSFVNGSLRIENIKILAGARVEIWQSYNWYKCYKYCTKWETVRKWKYIAITKNDIKVKSDVKINLRTKANILTAVPEFKELRLDHNVFDLFNLAPLANRFLSTEVHIYDANKFVQTIPLIEKDFRITVFEVAAAGNVLSCGITLERMP